jgi:tRNA(Arg) A34 adenosine deaminase TadA
LIFRRIFIALIVVIALLLAIPHFYLLLPRTKISGEQRRALVELAGKALKNEDVPIGALVLYNGEIIGEGYNTVNKNNDPSGHAEINALRDAAKNRGVKEFRALDRSRLTLVSTYEPCKMCKGAILNENIKTVQICEPKSFGYLFSELLSLETYEVTKRLTGDDNLQDSLFQQHPGYNP